MPRAPNNVVENSFINGLITEATSLNFPQNACTDTDNCVFHPKGNIYRRNGLDFEKQYETLLVNRGTQAINSYYWRNASGLSDKDFFVLQVGGNLYFYSAVNPTSKAVSSGAYPVTYDFSVFASSTSDLVNNEPCQFTSGQGYLFVTHPYTDPFYVEYNEDTDRFTLNKIDVIVRDTKGVIDETGVSYETRPTTLSNKHKYNLYNQGWYPREGVNYINIWHGSGAGVIWAGGSPYVLGNKGAPAGGVDSYPSNADVWWVYKDAYERVDFSTSLRYDRGGTPAPKGHYTFSAWNINRNSIVAGVENTSSDIHRPAATSFYAGRVWFSGVSSQNYANRLYFSQIAQFPEFFGRCHQQNDPTNEFLFDLLATDGGTIDILECGTIIKLFPMGASLLVFASNGVWVVSGNQGIGFSPNDFSVRKIASIPALTASSFVDVDGSPIWWNNDGIYTVTITNPAINALEVVSLSERTIKSFYNDIPTENKKYVRGSYNTITRQVQWVYRQRTIVEDVDKYEFDRALTYNSISKAFYPWSFPHKAVKVLGIQGMYTYGTSVVNEYERELDGSYSVNEQLEKISDRVQSTFLTAAVFKYVVAYQEGSQYRITFAETYDTSYKDFYSFDNTGNNFSSYFITGYKLDGQASMKFQQNYVHVYASSLDYSEFFIQGIWDFATSINAGRHTSRQKLIFDPLMNRQYEFRKVKLRGNGKAVQLKFISEEGKPFDISGWARFETANRMP